MSLGLNVNGPNVILAQMSMGPNVSGPNVHSGPNVLGPNVFGPIAGVNILPNKWMLHPGKIMDVSGKIHVVACTNRDFSQTFPNLF